MKFNIKIEKKYGSLYKYVTVRKVNSPYMFSTVGMFLFMKKRAIKKALNKEKSRFREYNEIENYTVEG